MPLYLFENIKTNEIREIFFKMSDEKIYNGEDDKEKNLWKRVYLAPNASIDTQIDPFDKNAYIRKTSSKVATIGEMWDQSAALSRKRAEKLGYDPVKAEFTEKYKKDHHGNDSLLKRAEKKSGTA